MVKCDFKNVRESLKGAGACDIGFEVLQRSGKPNWWCRTHGLPASAPDGAALERCPGAWFEPVPDELRLELDFRRGEVAVWGVVPAALTVGTPPATEGKVHVHWRLRPEGPKEIDRSFDLVLLRNGDRELLVEGMAAVAFSMSELSGREMTPLTCPHCGGQHIDELKFATYPHHKHVCNSCGRSFWDRTGPSVSNPLARAHEVLDVAPAPSPVLVNRALELDSRSYGSLMLWPSNSAIVSTMSRPEEVGVHVHAWGSAGDLLIDETHSPVTLDGTQIDERALRSLALQRALAHGAPIVSMDCSSCGSALVSPSDSWIEPVTVHECSECGATMQTRRRVFLNPLAEKPE